MQSFDFLFTAATVIVIFFFSAAIVIATFGIYS